jgi:hypothetical protein
MLLLHHAASWGQAGSLQCKQALQLCRCQLVNWLVACNTVAAGEGLVMHSPAMHPEVYAVLSNNGKSAHFDVCVLLVSRHLLPLIAKRWQRAAVKGRDRLPVLHIQACMYAAVTLQP